MKSRTLKVLLAAAMMAGSFAAGVMASDGIERVEAFLRRDFKVYLDGRLIDLKETPPLLYDEKTYLPLRRIAELVNVDIVWQDATRSIYLNTRYPGQPEAPVEDDGTYKEITMLDALGYTVTYLGKDHPLFTIRDTTYRMYYRVDDLNRMGIDTRGVLKSKEKYTGYLFISQEELVGLWKQQPLMRQQLGPIITGVTDEDLKQQLYTFATETIQLLGKHGIDNYYAYAQVVLIDAVPNHPNWFFLYSREQQGKYFVYALKMSQDEKGNWYQSGFNKTQLEYLSALRKELGLN